jgi:cytoskeletal protein CcmA (bactofilin family)
MSDIQIPGGPYINSIIGEGTCFNGEFDLNGLLRIDGDFCGTVRTDGKVLIGKNGRAECTVYAGTVVIGGIVRGNIFANEKVVILSTGIVLGNIHCPRFIVEEGVIFNGTAKIIREERAAKVPPAGESAKKKVEDLETFAPVEGEITEAPEEIKDPVSASSGTR